MKTVSPRIFLRFLQPEDAKVLFRLLSNPLVIQKLPDEDHLLSLSQAQDVLEEMIVDTKHQRRFCQALVSLSDQIVIGTLVANRFNRKEKSAYIAYELDPKYWGQGLMKEGIQQFLSLLQTLFSLTEVKAQTTLDNFRSQHLLEKLGFIKGEIFKYKKPIKGQFVRALLYKRILS